MTSELANGSRLMGSLGAAIVHGRAEDGPGTYVSTTGRGLSLACSRRRSTTSEGSRTR